MDRIKETADILIKVNQYHKKQLPDFELINAVCGFFDTLKDESIGQADLQFLRYLANTVGIPHFFDLLQKFENNTSHEVHALSTLSSMLYESTLHTSEGTKVHRYQKTIMDLFVPGVENRYFLSASTSFGKTHIVFEIIRKMQYKNVVLIFPTIALLSENLEKLTSNINFDYFKSNYEIHTLSEVAELGDRNLFIYTPERFLSFVEKQNNSFGFDFAFVDEVYKIDNDYLIDEEVKENERDVAYRLAVYYTLKPSVDILLAGPYIDFSQVDQKNYNGSFDRFLSLNGITLINYNDYEIVNKSYHDIKGARSLRADDKLRIEFVGSSKNDRLIELVSSLLDLEENAIIYCSTRGGTEGYARKMEASQILVKHDTKDYQSFLDHVERFFGDDWVVFKALKCGIGIHHGLVPKYIQKEIVDLFNKGELKVLFSTTTITEGVNTSAKNLIVLHDTKGTKALKKFDAKNIAGRAGRFLHHYSGRVLVLKNDFMKVINSEPEGIKHKNYDLEAPKDEIDLYYTQEEFLKPDDRQRLVNIAALQSDRQIPDEIFNMYKVISRIDKITIYDRIALLESTDFAKIRALINRLNFNLDIDSNGFQVVINVLLPIIKNKKLEDLITRLDRNERYSILTHFVHFYLDGGFIGSMNYKLTSQQKTKDEAVKETAEFVYNTLKYQVVKYVGVFNIMYRFFISKTAGVPFDEVPGLDRLLTKLEYNALSEKGRIASDYGVPSSIIDFYENEENQDAQSIIKKGFDLYEEYIFQKIESIINKPQAG